MRAYILLIVIAVAALTYAAPLHAQVADPPACQYTNGGTTPPDLSACLGTIDLSHRYRYIMWRLQSTNPYTLCDYDSSSQRPFPNYTSTPQWPYHNASQNYTPYSEQANKGNYCNSGNLATGGSHDLNSAYGFNPRSFDTPILTATTGFTVMIMSWIDEGEAATGVPKDYVTLADGNNKSLYTLGRKDLTWGLRTATGSGAPAYWQFPWDSAAYSGYFQLVFYTFSPDGKVEIDSFHDSSHDDPNGHDFESSLIDFGQKMDTVGSGTPTSNPTSYNFTALSSNALYLGQMYSDDSYGTGFQEVMLMDTPISRGQIAAYASSLRGASSGQFYPNSCNTGYMLNAAPPGGQSPTAVPPNVCGWSSNWSRKSATDTGGAAQLSTTDLEFSTQASPRPYESADQTVTLTNTGAGALSISSVTLAGDNPGDFSVDGDTCSGSTLAPGSTCTLQVGYTDYDQQADATLQIQSNASTPAPVITLEGQNG